MKLLLLFILFFLLTIILYIIYNKIKNYKLNLLKSISKIDDIEVILNEKLNIINIDLNFINSNLSINYYIESINENYNKYINLKNLVDILINTDLENKKDYESTINLIELNDLKMINLLNNIKNKKTNILPINSIISLNKLEFSNSFIECNNEINTNLNGVSIIGFDDRIDYYKNLNKLNNDYKLLLNKNDLNNNDININNSYRILRFIMKV